MLLKTKTMLQKSTLVVTMFAGLAMSLGVCNAANAQCSTCYSPTVAYRPVAYQSNYSGYTGWYPGYWLSRLFSPSSYYTPTYTASYAPSYYTASYAPTYQTVARPVALTSYYASSYAPSTCSTCNYGSCSTCNYGCNTCGSNPCGCGTQQVTLRPACYDTCSTCSTASCSTCGHAPCSCSASYATPAVYDSPATYPPSAPAQSSPSTPRTFSAESQPSLEPQSIITPERSTYPSSTEGSATRSSTSNYFEAPELFNPRDRVTQRKATPIWNAVYHKHAVAKQVAYRTVNRIPVDRAPVDRAQAERDAAGWNSVD